MRARAINAIPLLSLLQAQRTAAVPADFECAWRRAALKQARILQPALSPFNLDGLANSLNSSFVPFPDPNGHPTGGCFAASERDRPAARIAAGYIQPAGPSTHPGVAEALATRSFFVAVDGSDAAAGSELAPFRTIARGVTACRASSTQAGSKCALGLRAGVHRMNETITLTPADSGLTIMGAPGPGSSQEGKTVTISGATALTPSWKAVPGKMAAGMRLWATPVARKPASIKTLLVDGIRAISARYPNADPEHDKFPIGYIKAKTTWTAPADMGSPKYIHYTDINRTSFRSLFKDFRGGVGGQCAHYDPPYSYWCAETTQGGGAAQYVVPSGLSYTKALLPNSPYKDPEGALITAWRPGHWSNWGFEVGESTDTSFKFAKGGFQGGRGNHQGAEWFISGVKEELDVDREFWYDAKAGTLYYASATEPPRTGFEHAQLLKLFDIRGTQAAPVTDVIFSGLAFTGTAATFMEPHGVPSGGDWALQRTAALFFEGTEGCVIDSCVLQRLDGNAVMLSGYNQYANLTGNTFLYTGASAIALWGSTKGSHPLQPEGTGPDGTGGDFPRFTRIDSNFIRFLVSPVLVRG